MTPRLVDLDEARAYLGGRHPALLGISPVLRGVYDLRAIDAALDRKSNLVSECEPLTISVRGEDDQFDDDELARLSKRIEAHATGRL